MEWKSIKEEGPPEAVVSNLLLYSEQEDEYALGYFAGTEFQCDEESMYYIEDCISHYMEIVQPK